MATRDPVIARKPPTARERDRLYQLASQSLAGALNALLNPPADGSGLTVALLQTGIALHRLVELDWDERSKADVNCRVGSLRAARRSQVVDRDLTHPGSNACSIHGPIHLGERPRCSYGQDRECHGRLPRVRGFAVPVPLLLRSGPQPRLCPPRRGALPPPLGDMTDATLGLVVATVGLVAWLYAAAIAPPHIRPLVSPTVMVALAMGMWLVSAGASIDSPFIAMIAAFNRAIVAGSGIVYAWRATRYRVTVRGRRRTLDVR